MLYRLHLRDEWDPRHPRGLVIFFHGNSSGSQRDVLTHRSAGADSALDLGLAMARVGSPQAGGDVVGADGFSAHFQRYVGSESGTRFWREEDRRLVHELLQSEFDGRIAVDFERVYFWGASGGTIFLTGFFEQYAGLYGGGLYAGCGHFWWSGVPRLHPRVLAHWKPHFPWTPSGAALVRDRYRVFVQTTTGDFLHKYGAPMAHYYGDVLGIPTRADIDGAGGHCSPGTVPSPEVLRWLSSDDNRHPARATSAQDADDDGISNARDDDDDNDGAWDFIDALPLDPRDWRDTDGDGIGDFEDRDADGDGVPNDQDLFSLNASEWSDADGDGIGDNLDTDDDNDGIPDAADSQPLEGTGADRLSFLLWDSARYHGLSWTYPTAFVHRGRPAGLTYPEARGDRQSYQSISLGDSTFEIMIDRTERKGACLAELLPELCEDPPSAFAYWQHHIDEIHVDRNRNGDLTDDGRPLVLARNRGDQYHLPSVGAVLEVSYTTGERLPYGIRFWTLEHLDDGLHFTGTSAWRGIVRAPAGEPVLVGVVDVDFDGRFDSEGSDTSESTVSDFPDFACVDTNRNGDLEECWGYPRQAVPDGSVSPGGLFELDGRTLRLMVSPGGHRVEIANP
ncbi:MAG: thrombospondin type 3 repeat-containing protein [Rhodospirillales bacterium]|nr:thrombospondin type 3 repeat-containing protein [Rhodospirillales bacterium]